MDLKDHQIRTRIASLNGFIVRGGQCLYKSVKHITNTIWTATVFFLDFSDPPSLGSPS